MCKSLRVPRVGCGFVFGFLISVGLMAQTPLASVKPSLPSDVFAGEAFCFETNLSNSGAPGFGPYLLAVLPVGVSFNSASSFGGGSGSVVGVFAADGMLTDPISGTVVTGPEGGTLIVVTLPVGSVVTGGPPLGVEICGTLAPDVAIGVPLDLSLIPAYEFGDTATGANGPIIGTTVVGQVVPVLAILEKFNTAPESERPPATSFPFEYVVTLDIANGSTLDNVVLQDVLPPEMQWTGDPITTTPGSCLVTPPNAPPTPGGTVSANCGTVAGLVGGPEVELRIPVYVTDILDESICDTEILVNPASADFDFMGTPFPTLTATDNDGPGEIGLLATHVALQKGASTNVLSPGQTVTYTHRFQVTDFATADSLVIVDTLPDGTTFSGTVSLTVGGAPVAITATVANDTPAAGQTTLTWDVTAVAGALPPGTVGTLVYQATIDQNYDPAGANNGEPLRAGDSLTNTARVEFDLGAGATACTNGTAATIRIRPVAIEKSIVDPSPVPAQFMPGETVTFRLTLEVPSGDVQSIRFTDFLPLPVFDVADFDPLTDASVASPPDTGDSTPSVSTDLPTNSIIVDWSDVTVAPTRLVVLSIDLRVTVSDEPFADGLALTNIMQAASANTPGEVLTDATPVQINVGAPVLGLTKGVNSTSGSGMITPAPSPPVDSDLSGADAGDTVTYVLTVENTGSEPAFQVTVTDNPPVGISSCSLDSVVDGTGAGLATSGTLSGGLLLSGSLDANDGNPAGGGPPYGGDTALITLTCTVDSTVQPGAMLQNTASATWASTATATSTFPAVSDDASVGIAQPDISKVISGVSPGYQASAPFTADEPVHIGEIVTYTVAVEVPEGTSQSVVLSDQLDRGLAFVDVVSVVADSGIATDVAGGFAGVAAAATITNVGSGQANLDRRLNLDFGNLTVPADNDPNNNTVTVTYRAVVLNWTNNNRGNRRNNSATWTLANPSGGTQQVQASAPNVRIAEAALNLQKSASPSFGDAGDTVQFSLTMTNSAPSNADAFDVTLSDALPAGVTFAGNLQVAPGCTAPPITGPSFAAGVISATWNRVDQGQTCTFTFDVTLDPVVNAGSLIENCFAVEWHSILAADQPLPAAPSNPLSAERTGDPTDPGGAVNDNRSEACASVMVTEVAISKTLSFSSEGHTGNGEIRPGVDDLTIGEEMTFELLVQLPEGTIPQLVVTDNLPIAPGVLEVTAARVTSVGGQITLPGAPSISLQDNSLGDGLNDTAVVDFGGPVTNAPDGSANDRDQILIEVDAVVVNVVGNNNGDQLVNSALVQFGPGLNRGDTLELDLVEPDLQITKQGDLSSGDAGDLVTFTLRVEHSSSSTADAFDVELEDTLPSGLTFAGFVGSGLGSCTATPDVGPSQSGGVISASWNDFPRSAVCELVFTATFDLTVQPGQTVVNTADLEWRSLDTTVNGNERIYGAMSSWPILITQPGLTKAVTATSVTETTDDQKGLAPDLTIGEQVTYVATVTFIDGTTPSAVLDDQLPNADVVLRLLSSRILSIGADLTVPGAAVGDPGDDCLPTCDGNGDGERDQAVWNLGNVVNQPDTDPDPDPADQLQIEVVAVVVNAVNNEGAPGVDLDQRNTVTLTSGSLALSAIAAVDIVAPELSVEKRVLCRDDDASNSCEPGEPAGDPLLVDAGDRVIYEIEIEHSTNSTAAAFGLTLSDVIPMAPGTTFVPGSVSAVVGVAPDSVSTPGGNLLLTWNDPLALGTRYVLRYAVTLGAGAMSGATYPNEATLGWDSLPNPADPENQASSLMDGASVTVFAPTIVKQASSTSLDDTGSAVGTVADFDLTIGELVTYTLTVVFAEGSSSNVVITDTTQNDANGLLTVVGASVVGLGNNITTTLPGTPVITSPDTVSFDFGTVTNAPDGSENADDTITLEVTAQVVNDNDPNPPALNMAGEVLTNTATVNFGAGMTAMSSATIDVVEPALALTKVLGPVVDGRVKVTLTARNTGSAPGFDLLLTDAFDEADFVPSSAMALMLPTGFELVQASDGSETTVTVRIAGDPTMPPDEAILEPGESVSVMFDIELQGGAMPPTTSLVNEASAMFSTLPGADSEERTYSTLANDTLQIPSLLATKTAMPMAAMPGQTVTFDIAVENMGDATATGLVVTETVPVHTVSGVNAGWFVAPMPSAVPCNGQSAGTQCFTVLASDLLAGASTSVSFVVVVDDPLPTGVELTSNQAQVDSAELPPKTTNPVEVTLIAAPDLTLSKDDGGATATPSSTITYTLVYDNVGNQTATGVVITETVPANTVAGTNPGWELSSVGSGTPCAGQAGGAVCVLSVGLVPVGGGGSASFSVVLDDPKPSGLAQITNTAVIGDDGSNGPDPTPGNNTGVDTTPVEAAPDLAVSKTDGGISTVPGATVSYTIGYFNNGNQDATNVVLTETVPANSTSGANPGWEVAPLGSGVACAGQTAGTQCVNALGSLAAGASGSASFAVVIDNPLPAGVTQVANTVTIGDDGSNGPDPAPGNNTGVDTTPVVAAPDLSVLKTDGAVTTVAGGTVSFTITYANNGNQGATGVVLSETVPANTSSGSNPGWEVAPAGSGVPCTSQPAGTSCVLTLGGLAAGAGGSATFVVVVDDPLPAGVTQITNTVLIGDDGSNGPDPTPGDNTATDPTPVDAAPDLSVVKDDGGVSTVPGGTVSFTLSYSNNGTQDATGVVLTETVPADCSSGTNPGWEVSPLGSGVSCDAQPAGTVCVLLVGNLAAGANGSASFLVQVDDPLPAAVEEISNTVVINDDGSNGPDPTPGDNSSTDPTPVVGAPDLTITKSDGGATSSAGATVLYTLSYSNVGDQGASGVELTETVPVNTTSGSNPGWEVSPAGSGTACDNQPAGTVCVLSLGLVAGGASGSASFALVVDNPLPAGVEEVANTVTIADDGSNGPDPSPGNNTGVDTTPVEAVPDLSVAKSDGDVTAAAGDTVSFTITYANNGNQDATGVVLTETVPANASSGTNPAWEVAPAGSAIPCTSQPAGTSCVLTLGGLAAGASGSATFLIVVDDPKPAGVTLVTNVVLIADDGSNGPDPTPGDNTGTETTPVDAAPDLAVVKDDGGVSTVPGGTVSFTLSYANNGTQDATGVVLTETVPADCSSGTNPGWEVSPLGSGVSCDAQPAGTVCVLLVGNLAAGASGSASFVVQVDDPLPAGVEEITNTVVINDDGSNGPDPTPGDNSSTDPTPVVAAPDLTITKSDGGATSSAGATVLYTLSYSNVGNQGASGVQLTETVPVNTTSASNPGWEVSPAGSGTACNGQPAGTVCVLSLGLVAGGASGSASFALVVDDPLPAGVEEVANTVTIADDGSNGPDPTPGNNTGVDTTPVEAVPDLSVAKSDGDVTAAAGDTVSFTITYANNGNQDATGVVLTETVPANTSSGANPGWEVSPVGSGTPCDSQPAGTVCVLPLGGLAAGASGSATFLVVVDDPKPAGVTQITNTVVIADDGSNGPDPSPGDNTGTDLTPVDASPDLEVRKYDGGVSTVPGGTVTYTLSYANNGTQDATGVVLTETVPADCSSGTNPGWEVSPLGSGMPCDSQPAGTVCVLEVGNLAVGETGSASFVVQVDDPLPAGVEEISNTALINDDGNNGPDPTPGDNSSTDPTPVVAAPDLTITKSDGGATSSAGATVLYTLSYSNVGNQGASGVQLTETVPVNTTSGSNPGWEVSPAGSGTACDNQPAGTVCVLSLGTVAGGAGGSASFALVVDNPLPAGVEEVANTVTIGDDGSNGPDPTPDNNTGVDTTPVEATPDLQVSKDDSGAIAAPGTSITYTLTYSNVGTQGATGVTLSETVPVATVSSVNPGWEVGTAGSGVACDAQPAGTVCVFSVGGVAAGDGGSVSFVVVVDDPKPAGVETISNTVTIGDDGSNGPDPTPDDNVSVELTPAEAGPDLTISKDDGGISSIPGATVTYTLSYGNVGSQNTTGVVLTETVPLHSTSGTNPGWEVAPVGSGQPCDGQPAATMCVLFVGDLAVGESGTASFEVVVDDPLAAGVDALDNSVSIADDGNSGPDQNPGNNVDVDQTPVVGMPEVELLKMAEQPDGEGYLPGETFVWTMELSNIGNQDLANLTLVDVLPSEVWYVPETMVLDGVILTDAAGDDAGEFDGAQTLTVHIAELAVGQTVTLIFVTEVSGEDPDDDSLVINQATVTDPEGNNIPSDNPGTMPVGDPTTVPLTIVANIYEIPTLDRLGLLVLGMLIALLSLRLLRQRGQSAS